MDFKDKKIGIWGLGKVGRAALEYFSRKNCNIQVLDQRKITQKEIANITKNLPQKESFTLTFVTEDEKFNFLEHNNLIVASPGVDLRKYSLYKHKFLTELDILQKEFCKPIISITGSVGKTSVTHMLSHMLKYSTPKDNSESQEHPLQIWTGGNIGTPMLNLVREKNIIDLAVLEASSYQLEHCKIFAPDIALWTNFYPNHLDRHGNLENYFNAKLQMIKNQNKLQCALLPLTILKNFKDFEISLDVIHSKLYFFSQEKPEYRTIEKLKKYKNIQALFYLEKQNIIKISFPDITQSIIDSTRALASFTFPENILLILSTLTIMNIKLVLSDTKSNNFKMPPIKPIEHRIEKVATVNNITFYNDSKSTTMASTIAAVKKLANKPIILLLGGLSKGVDRSPLIKKIKLESTKNPIKIISFGQEAEILKKLCTQEKLTCQSYKTLDEAAKSGFAQAKPKDQILLSPSGSSFDLFKNFEERGKYFKKLILQIENSV